MGEIEKLRSKVLRGMAGVVPSQSLDWSDMLEGYRSIIAGRLTFVTGRMWPMSSLLSLGHSLLNHTFPAAFSSTLKNAEAACGRDVATLHTSMERVEASLGERSQHCTWYLHSGVPHAITLFHREFPGVLSALTFVAAGRKAAAMGQAHSTNLLVFPRAVTAETAQEMQGMLSASGGPDISQEDAQHAGMARAEAGGSGDAALEAALGEKRNWSAPDACLAHAAPHRHDLRPRSCGCSAGRRAPEGSGGASDQ